MKILIINRCVLPLPAVLGGAVETLIDSYLDENEKIYHDDIDVVSIPIPSDYKSNVKKYRYSNFIYIKNKSVNSLYNLCCRTSKKLGMYVGDYFINSAIKEIKKLGKEYDIIISENEPFYTMILRKHFNSKIVLHLHNDFLNVKTPFYKKILENCDYILPVSDYIKKCVNCPNKCITTYNGIDFDLFKNDNKENDKLRYKYNISNNDFVYIFVGRVVPDKGVDELIDAFLELNNIYKDTKLFIIGSPNSGGNADNSFYNQMLNKKNSNIIFTGYVANNLIYKYYNISDVQITPSTFEEPFGLTVIEALAMGKRIIVTDSGALPEIVDKKYGVIVNRDDLVNNLYKAMEDEYLNRKSNKNCLVELKKFSKEEYAKRVYENLVFINNHGSK